MRCFGAEQLECELAQLAGEIGLIKIFEWTRWQVPHQYARSQLGHVRLIARDGPGEDVDFDATGGEALGNLDHIDVKAARVAGPRLLKRRSMDADGCYPP
jgi:hypothetical protein